MLPMRSGCLNCGLKKAGDETKTVGIEAENKSRDLQQQNVQEATENDQLETFVVQTAQEQTTPGGTGGRAGVGVWRFCTFFQL